MCALLLELYGITPPCYTPLSLPEQLCHELNVLGRHPPRRPQQQPSKGEQVSLLRKQGYQVPMRATGQPSLKSSRHLSSPSILDLSAKFSDVPVSPPPRKYFLFQVCNIVLY